MPRDGVVIGVTGQLLRIRWSTGEEIEHGAWSRSDRHHRQGAGVIGQEEDGFGQDGREGREAIESQVRRSFVGQTKVTER